MIPRDTSALHSVDPLSCPPPSERRFGNRVDSSLQHALSHLLTDSNMKVRDVSAAGGFNSPGRFYAAFRRLTGQRPAAFRESIVNR
ncbi:MAG: helix-turn-helix domain-containing protein [Planctomycetota bacterium]